MRILFWVMVALAAVPLPARAAPLPLVAAENFYGDVASQIGGEWVAVTSILNNPAADPHLFAASPAIARAVARARIVVWNGAGYDEWMARLLAASPRADRRAVEVAALMHRKPGDNPHLWYDPGTMPMLADALAALLSDADPGHRDAYARNLATFRRSLAPLTSKIAAMHAKYRGVPVTATEPVFGEMAAALGLDMRNLRFQLAVMNGTAPGASDIAAFQQDLMQRRVGVLIYNSQTTDRLTARMRRLAKAHGIPVLGVTETEPAGQDYQQWMMAQLSALDAALSRTGH